ncbi:MAG: hypothetical protein DRQ58_06235 [Gammaproteobacteria bacterium]|nr:MAG: hypothetical protein DRQ58_06235 [Gammaproteobacteria bacterium]
MKKKNKPKPLPQPAPPDLSKEQTVKERRTDILCWAVLFILGTILYGHTLDAPWYHDDLPNIVNNPNIRDLSTALTKFFRSRGPAYFSFAVNYELSGYSLPAFHITNICIHILTSGLVFLVAKRVFPNQHHYAALVALIFLVHPLQTQAVTYIVQRMASLATLFGFLCIYLYCRAREQLNSGVKWSNIRHLNYWSLALVSCYLAVKTKENLAVLPLLMLLFDYFYLSRAKRLTRSLKAEAVYIVPFFLSPLSVALNRLISPLIKGESLQSIASVQEAGITPLQYLVTEFQVLWIYLKLLIVPYPQIFDYVYPVTKTLLTVQNVMAFAGLVTLILTAFLVRNRYSHLCFGICWFFLGLAVESTLLPLDPVFEHRLYLSMFGFAVFIIGMGHYFLPKKAVIPLTLCCLLIWGGLTWRRNQMWNNDLVLYLDNAKYVTPDDGFSIALSKTFITRELFPEAIEVLTKAVEAGAEKAGVYSNLAFAYRRNNQPNESIEVIKTALKRGIKGRDFKIELARSYYKLKEYDKAIKFFRSALKDGRRRDLIVKELGLTLAETGQFIDAEPYLQATFKLHPESVTLRIYIAQAKIKQGEMDTAEILIREVVDKNPYNTSGWFVLGLLGLESRNEMILNEALEQLYRLDKIQAQKLKMLISAQRS